MKTNDVLIITTVALGTAALTISSLWPSSLNAGDEASMAPEISKPKLISHGLELTLQMKPRKTPVAGEQPIFEVKALSLTNITTDVNLRLAMSAAGPADVFSRVIRVPEILWTDQRSLTVPPGGTKVVSFSPAKHLPPNKLISVSLQEVGTAGELTAPAPVPPLAGMLRAEVASREGLTLSFSTAVDATRPALVTSR